MTLILTDYELGYLTAFSHQCYEYWCDYDRESEDAWYGIQVGNRMFDLNLWRTDLYQLGDESQDTTVYCSVYECYKSEIDDEHWTVNSDHRYFLWKREDA